MKAIKNMTEQELTGQRVETIRETETMAGNIYPEGSKGTITRAYHGVYVTFDKCPCCGRTGSIKFKNKQDAEDAIIIIKED